MHFLSENNAEMEKPFAYIYILQLYVSIYLNFKDPEFCDLKRMNSVINTELQILI